MKFWERQTMTKREDNEPEKTLIIRQCGPPKCKDGEHQWDGPTEYSEDGCSGWSTCSKCGVGYNEIVAWI